MFGIIIYDILFFAIPAIIIALLGVSIYRYLSAKRKNKLTPGAVSPEEMKKRKIWLIVSAHTEGLYRVDKRSYPTEAIREALLNAIVNREYGFSASTLISIFDNRIELVSIGGLARGISQSDILLGISITRNKKLADVFYRLYLIEAYGTGMPKIIEGL